MILVNRKYKNSGLTLLEVLIAVSIFSIIMTALYSTFRTGMKAYQVAQDNMSELQQVRFIFDTISKDFKTIYYLDESAYNVQANARINSFEKEHSLALQEGKEDEFLAKYDEGLAKLMGKDEIDVEENPYNQSICIDLNMSASDNDLLDTITFVNYQMPDYEAEREPWGLKRVTWVVEDERLIRKSKPIFIPERDFDGEILEEVEESIDIIGKNIIEFDIKYGYFCADKWLETDEWNSSEKGYRNPLPELEPEDPDYDQVSKLQQTIPDDGLPAYARITITIADSIQKAQSDEIEKRHPRTFSTIINFSPAQENFIPVLDEDSDLYDLTYNKDPEEIKKEKEEKKALEKNDNGEE